VSRKTDEVMCVRGPVWSRMTGTPSRLAVPTAVRIAACISVCCWASGCSLFEKPKPTVAEMIAFPGGNVIAVAPALNFSGSSAFDPVVVGDVMASELATLPGVGVIGVNRVMAVLAEHDLARVQSPQHAVEICERLGADAIVVFAITEYDPYTPVVGITAQLYTRHRRPTISGNSPGQEPGATATAPADDSLFRPIAECQRVFNATHERVQNAVREYADKRNEGESPYGWRKYVASQQLFLRFCCHAVARELLMQPVEGFSVVRVAEG
jgi:hypothetical protein